MVIVTVIIVIVSILLVAIVLMQKSKGGGLAAGFQSSNQIMGAPKTANMLEKITWSLMAFIAVLCIVCSFMGKSEGTTTTGSSLQGREVEQAPIMPETSATDEATEAPADAAPATPAAEEPKAE